MKKRKAKPHDWRKQPGGLYGGNLEDFPQPVAWYWPRGSRTCKRRVDCTICTWKDLCAGAKHWHATVRELENCAWNGERWAFPWGNHEGGQIFTKACDTEDQAVRWINRILKKHFSPETHEISCIENRGRNPAKLVYRRMREGD